MRAGMRNRRAARPREAETQAAATVKAVAVNFRRAFLPVTLDPGEPESDRGAQKDFITWRGGGIIACKAAALISVVTGLPL